MSKDFIALSKKIRNGMLIPSANMPTHLYALPDKKLPKDNTVMFRISSGLFLVNEAVYEVFIQHNLGDTQFSKAFIYHIETEEQLSDVPYYFINVGERRNFFDNENSKQVSEDSYMPNQPERYIQSPKDNDIQLNNSVLDNDVDVWHEPLLFNSMFFSDKLVQALFAIGVTREDFGLVCCQVQ